MAHGLQRAKPFHDVFQLNIHIRIGLLKMGFVPKARVQSISGSNPHIGRVSAQR
jgi:hypothetical protein